MNKTEFELYSGIDPNIDTTMYYVLYRGNELKNNSIIATINKTQGLINDDTNDKIEPEVLAVYSDKNEALKEAERLNKSLKKNDVKYKIFGMFEDSLYETKNKDLTVAVIYSNGSKVLDGFYVKYILFSRTEEEIKNILERENKSQEKFWNHLKGSDEYSERIETFKYVFVDYVDNNIQIN